MGIRRCPLVDIRRIGRDSRDHPYDALDSSGPQPLVVEIRDLAGANYRSNRNGSCLRADPGAYGPLCAADRQGHLASQDGPELQVILDCTRNATSTDEKSILTILDFK